MNTITQSPSVNFQSRQLIIKKPETFPKQILQAVEDSPVVNDFVYGKQKEFTDVVGSVKNFFKSMFGANEEKKEVLEVSYDSVWNSGKNLKAGNLEEVDPFEKTVIVRFELKDMESKANNNPVFNLEYTQKGEKKTAKSQHFNTQYTYYEEPRKKAEDVLLWKLEHLADINRHLQYKN